MKQHGEEKIKVCFLSPDAYPYFNSDVREGSGGAQLQLYLFATELAKDSNFEAYFIVKDYGQPKKETIENVHLRSLTDISHTIRYVRFLRRAWTLGKALYKIRPDVCIQRSVGLDTFFCAVFCLFSRTKFIYMVACDEDVQLEKPSWMHDGFAYNIIWKLFKWALVRADLVVVQHEKQKTLLERNYHKSAETRLSAHRISHRDATHMQKKEGVLWVGRAIPLKQSELFFELARQFPREKFTMIAPVSNDREYFEKIKKEAESISNLKFLDFVPYEEMEEYFRRAKVFVNTSTEEGFPNTFIQAAKEGVPVVSFNVDPGKMLSYYEAGFLAEGDFSKLAEYVRTLIDSPKMYQEMSENSLAYAIEYHDISSIIKCDKVMLQKLHI